jgi:hypothetical protein
MTLTDTVRSALDFVSINFTFRSNSYLDTLDLLDLAFQRRLRGAAMNNYSFSTEFGPTNSNAYT